jgi:hypothetical protein
MKKILILMIALAGISYAADTGKVIFREAVLSTPTTNVVTFVASNNRVTEPVLIQQATTGTNTMVITVTPAGTTDVYTMKTGAATTNTTEVIVANDYSSSTSPKIILLPGDTLKITGTAGAWTLTDYRVVVKETLQ